MSARQESTEVNCPAWVGPPKPPGYPLMVNLVGCIHHAVIDITVLNIVKAAHLCLFASACSENGDRPFWNNMFPRWSWSNSPKARHLDVCMCKGTDMGAWWACPASHRGGWIWWPAAVLCNVTQALFWDACVTATDVSNGHHNLRSHWSRANVTSSSQPEILPC